MAVKPPCEVEGCTSLAYRRTYCCKHYERWRKYGDVNFVFNNRHGYADTPTHHIWRGMKDRCSRQNNPDYHQYGGRGIRVCDRWLGPEGFMNFLEDMGERPSNLTIDRIDPNGNYEPSNCRWATRQEQADNRRVTLRYKGKLVREWADLLGIRHSAMKSAVIRHKSLEKAVLTYRASAKRQALTEKEGR